MPILPPGVFECLFNTICPFMNNFCSHLNRNKHSPYQLYEREYPGFLRFIIQLGLPKDIPEVTKTIKTPFPQFAPGTSLANRYEIIGEIGKGGMGEVYLAEDTNLKRKVAIKVLPQPFALDKEMLARFEREARLLASLNHPNIATIHGLEKSDGQQFLVMELVEGETLAERIKKGPLPVEEALEVCRQIAEGLEAAHEKGIIHRDLKPANVKVTPEGKVKILDFGLAKAFESAVSGEAPGVDLSKSPTITVESSHSGVILGTAAYMSPEQARGKPLDKKTDIWSFGCVLFEAIIGRQAFKGDTISDTIAAILKSEPDWKAIPETTPLKLRDLLLRCLQKDPHNRLHDIADARIDIEDILTGTPVDIIPAARLAPKWRILFWIMGGLFLIVSSVLLWKIFSPSRTEPGQVHHLMIRLSERAPLAPSGIFPLGIGRTTLTLSPDGSMLAFVALADGRTQLYLRQMDQDDNKPILGTEGAHSPFFSPDGRWIGFFADEKLKKVALSGGEPETLCAASLAFGGSWGSDDVIYFVPTDFTEIWKVSSAGGVPEPLMALDTQKESPEYNWPEVLPGGNAVLYSHRDGGVAVYALKSGKRKMLLDKGSYARYSPTGHIVFGDRGKLRAVPFDLDKLEVTGLPVTVLDGIKTEFLGAAQFTYSEDGSLIYVPGVDATLGTLMWIDRNGKSEPLGLPQADYGAFKISPDGDMVAIPIKEEGNTDIWIYNLIRATLTRFTFGQSDSGPIWTPDGKWIIFRSERGGTNHFYRKLADGSGEAEQITDNEPCIGTPISFSPDGNLISYICRTSQLMDIWILSMKGGQAYKPFLQTQFTESFPAFSPDGQWIAYNSDESGRWEVYIRPYPGPGGKWRVSTDGC